MPVPGFAIAEGKTEVLGSGAVDQGVLLNALSRKSSKAATHDFENSPFEYRGYDQGLTRAYACEHACERAGKSTGPRGATEDKTQVDVKLWPQTIANH